MDKREKNQLLKCFDNICKSKQYVQHFKGVRIVSYNNEIDELLTIQFTHRFNDFVYTKTFNFNSDMYEYFTIEHFEYYYNYSLELAFNKFASKNEILI